MQRYVVDHETCSISGAFFCCKNSIFSSLGGFSLAFPNSFQDVDFCLRARRQQLRCVLSPSIRLLHFESSSREPTVDDETIQMLRNIHADLTAPMDAYQLWRYQPIHVEWLSIHGLVYLRNQTKPTVKRLVAVLLRLLWPKPRTRYRFLID